MEKEKLDQIFGQLTQVSEKCSGDLIVVNAYGTKEEGKGGTLYTAFAVHDARNMTVALAALMQNSEAFRELVQAALAITHVEGAVSVTQDNTITKQSPNHEQSN